MAFVGGSSKGAGGLQGRWGHPGLAPQRAEGIEVPWEHSGGLRGPGAAFPQPEVSVRDFLLRPRRSISRNGQGRASGRQL